MHEMYHFQQSLVLNVFISFHSREVVKNCKSDGQANRPLFVKFVDQLFLCDLKQKPQK